MSDAQPLLIWEQERPTWCPHADCEFLRRVQDALCGGKLPKPESHDGDHNTHRMCQRDGDDGTVYDWQVNATDLDGFRWIFDALDGKVTSWRSRRVVPEIGGDANHDAENRSQRTTDVTEGGGQRPEAGASESELNGQVSCSNPSPEPPKCEHGEDVVCVKCDPEFPHIPEREAAQPVEHWDDEDPGSCPECGKSHQWVRPGKTQPTCDCDETCPIHGRNKVVYHREGELSNLSGYFCIECQREAAQPTQTGVPSVDMKLKDVSVAWPQAELNAQPERDELSPFELGIMLWLDNLDMEQMEVDSEHYNTDEEIREALRKQVPLGRAAADELAALQKLRPKLVFWQDTAKAMEQARDQFRDKCERLTAERDEPPLVDATSVLAAIRAQLGLADGGDIMDGIDKLAALRAELATHDGEIYNKMADAIRDLSKRKTDLTAKCERLAAENEQLEAEMAKILLERMASQKRYSALIKDLRAKCERLSDMLKIRTAERDDSNNVKVVLEQSIDKLLAQRQELEAQLDKAVAALERIEEAEDCMCEYGDFGGAKISTCTRCVVHAALVEIREADRQEGEDPLEDMAEAQEVDRQEGDE